MRKTIEFCALTFLALMVIASPAFQQGPTTSYVNTTDPTCRGYTPCYTSLQTVVNAVQPGETVLLQAGVYNAPLTGSVPIWYLFRAAPGFLLLGGGERR